MLQEKKTGLQYGLLPCCDFEYVKDGVRKEPWGKDIKITSSKIKTDYEKGKYKLIALDSVKNQEIKYQRLKLLSAINPNLLPDHRSINTWSDISNNLIKIVNVYNKINILPKKNKLHEKDAFVFFSKDCVRNNTFITEFMNSLCSITTNNYFDNQVQKFLKQ